MRVNDSRNDMRNNEFLRGADKLALPMQVTLYLLLALCALLWWIGPEEKRLGFGMGLMGVIGLWVYTLNHIPTRGLKMLADPMVKYFQLPVTIIATIGFLIGFIVA